MRDRAFNSRISNHSGGDAQTHKTNRMCNNYTSLVEDYQILITAIHHTTLILLSNSISVC